MVAPSAQSVPREPVRAAGTRTRHAPASSTYRNGFSRLSGVVSSVVYGGSGKPVSAGAPTVPAKTWFHTPLVQLPTSELRVIHCCCEPLTTVPARESARKPPLANCGPAVQ